MSEQSFPYPVSYAMSRMFRVMHVNVGTFHVEQEVPAGPKGETTWKILAISQHFDPAEAIGVMHEAQQAYIAEVRKRRNQIRALS